MTLTHEAAARRPGRPRSAEADTAIVDATLDLIIEGGIDGLSVESVAARAGVGKATIYRRWANKDELIEDALASINDALPEIPPAGTARDRLVVMVDQIRAKTVETCSGRLMPRMLSYATQHPELFKQYFTSVIQPRRERYRVVLAEGIAAGELRADLDIELAATLVAAPMLYLQLMQVGLGTPAPGTSQALVDMVLDGIRAG
jgi:AcrR family transcriptional regulator